MSQRRKQEIQIEFDANGHIELIRSSHEPIALKTLKSDISQLGFNMNEENRHKGYTEYEYVRPGSEIELNLLVSEVDKQITSLVISKYAKD